jgi:hypothetical protein
VTDVVSAASFQISEIETEILLSKTTSEFSHTLDLELPFGFAHGSQMQAKRRASI